jgi:trimeric autotransporter adhesin
MTSSYTTNKSIEKPANGDYNNTWSTPVNNDWDIIDQSLGGQTALNAVGASGVVTLSTAQYRSPIIIITGLLTANVNYQLPAGIGGFWYVYNNTTGAFTVTFSSAAGGTTLTLAQGYTTTCISDGTNIGRGDTAPGTGGTGTVTSVNASGGTTGLTFSGGPITSAGTLTAGGTLIAANGGTGLTSPGAAGQVLTSNGTTWVSQAITGTVSSVTGSGSGINVSPTSGAVVVSNTGVTAATAGTGISVSGATGNVTFTNSGVTSIVAGSGISISGATGAVTITATGGGGSGTFSLSDGSVSAPSLNFTNDTNTGLYLTQGALTGTVNGVRAFYSSDGTASTALGNRTFNAFFGVGAGTGVNDQSCVAIGNSAISSSFSASCGSGCTAVGYQALRAVTGLNNTGIGSGAGFNVTSGNNVTCLGATASASSATASNEITLGNSSVATLRCQVTTITSLSDARDKKDIAELDAGLDFVNALNPVRFTWNMRPTEGLDGEMVQGRKDDLDTGFIAQDLKAVQEQLGVTIPGLVYDSNPDKLEAGYGKLLPVLVKAIQELSAKVDALEAQLASS